MLTRYRSSRNGFTLVELLIVIVIIAILAAVTAVAYNGIQARAIDARRASMTTAFQKALENYFTINNRYPTQDEINTPTILPQLGLTRENLVPNDCKNLAPNLNIDGYWTSEAQCGISYFVHPEPDGSGFTCTGTTICRHYSIGYWSTAQHKAIYLQNGR